MSQEQSASRMESSGESNHLTHDDSLCTFPDSMVNTAPLKNLNEQMKSTPETKTPIAQRQRLLDLNQRFQGLAVQNRVQGIQKHPARVAAQLSQADVLPRMSRPAADNLETREGSNPIHSKQETQENARIRLMKTVRPAHPVETVQKYPSASSSRHSVTSTGQVSQRLNESKVGDECFQKLLDADSALPQRLLKEKTASQGFQSGMHAIREAEKVVKGRQTQRPLSSPLHSARLGGTGTQKLSQRPSLMHAKGSPPIPPSVSSESRFAKQVTKNIQQKLHKEEQVSGKQVRVKNNSASEEATKKVLTGVLTAAAGSLALGAVAKIGEKMMKSKPLSSDPQRAQPKTGQRVVENTPRRSADPTSMSRMKFLGEKSNRMQNEYGNYLQQHTGSSSKHNTIEMPFFVGQGDNFHIHTVNTENVNTFVDPRILNYSSSRVTDGQEDSQGNGRIEYHESSSFDREVHIEKDFVEHHVGDPDRHRNYSDVCHSSLDPFHEDPKSAIEGDSSDMSLSTSDMQLNPNCNIQDMVIEQHASQLPLGELSTKKRQLLEEQLSIDALSDSEKISYFKQGELLEVQKQRMLIDNQESLNAKEHFQSDETQNTFEETSKPSATRTSQRENESYKEDCGSVDFLERKTINTSQDFQPKFEDEGQLDGFHNVKGEVEEREMYIEENIFGEQYEIAEENTEDQVTENNEGHYEEQLKVHYDEFEQSREYQNHENQFEEDQYREKQYEEDKHQEEQYNNEQNQNLQNQSEHYIDEHYIDEQYQEEQYQEEQYQEEQYQEEQYQDEQYQDEQYQDEHYQDEQYQGERYQDEQYQDEQYQDGQYQDGEYHGDQYKDEQREEEQIQDEQYQDEQYHEEQHQDEQYQDEHCQDEQYEEEWYQEEQYHEEQGDEEDEQEDQETEEQHNEEVADDSE